jgi:2-polyprenyl-3-methyl-5-hydroxy-6-metoxy-1,4-benzoquinol methylase
MREPWNHNLHYHGVLLDAIPAAAASALDVGCGEGVLARRLRERVPTVVGIDRDEPSIALARRQGGDIDYRAEDFLTADLGCFDFVACVAALHHMDAEAGLRRMAESLRPGGVLAVLGLARPNFPADLARELAAPVVSHAVRLTRRKWQPPVPIVWPPPHTYAEVRALAERVLPGVRYRRHLLWRYSLVWAKP